MARCAIAMVLAPALIVSGSDWDHRVSEGLECIVNRAQALEAKQQAPELVLPGEDLLNGPEALLENGWIEAQFAAPLRRFTPTRVFGNVGNHAPVENRLAVGPAVVDAVQTDNWLPTFTCDFHARVRIASMVGILQSVPIPRQGSGARLAVDLDRAHAAFKFANID